MNKERFVKGSLELFTDVVVANNIPNHHYYRSLERLQKTAYLELMVEIEGYLPATFEVSGWMQVDTDHPFCDTYRLRVTVKR